MKITTANANFSITILGSGPKNVIAFHGVGQDSKVFEVIAANHPEYTVYAIDLPFHGNTEVFKTKNPLSQKEIVNLVQKVIDHFNIQKFILLGYSIGAKMALSLIEPFSSRINNIWLLAPDGIGPNFWYRLGTKTKVGRYVLHKALKHSHVLNSFGSALKTMGLMDKNTARLIAGTTNSKDKGMQVYQIWLYLRELSPDLATVAKVLNDNSIPLNIVLGDRDRMITKHSVKPLTQKVPKANITMLHSKHQNLIDKFAACDLKDFS